MFHRFKAKLDGSLVAVGIVMPDGVAFVDWLEDEHQDDATAYPGGISEVLDDIERINLDFEWVDDPDDCFNDKVMLDEGEGVDV